MAYSYKTAIEFGLVYIPITLHACVKSHDIGFNMLYKKTKQKIKYKKTCENCPANIPIDDIIKGYERVQKLKRRLSLKKYTAHNFKPCPCFLPIEKTQIRSV